MSQNKHTYKTDYMHNKLHLFGVPSANEIGKPVWFKILVLFFFAKLLHVQSKCARAKICGKRV
jgi:hypothetical protein